MGRVLDHSSLPILRKFIFVHLLPQSTKWIAWWPTKFLSMSEG
jgi:hypothetical protein